MPMNELDTKKFWEERLKKDISLRGTGHRAFDLKYNSWLYKAQEDTLKLLLSNHNISISGWNVLDVGSGNGFYIEQFIQEGAAHIHGIDISESSVTFLRKTFPSVDFSLLDITSPQLNKIGEFDLVSAISVLFHIVDDDKFTFALQNIVNQVKPGGLIILSDSFSKFTIPLGSHVKFRDISVYQSILNQYHCEIIDLIPIFYLLNRSFIPLIGPRIISLLSLGELFYLADRKLRTLNISNLNGAKFLLSRRVN